MMIYNCAILPRQSTVSLHTHREPIMMTSSNENIFRVTGLLCGEFTGDRWIPRTKASDEELWCFLWSAPDPTVEKTMEKPVIWDAFAFIVTSLWWIMEIIGKGYNPHDLDIPGVAWIGPKFFIVSWYPKNPGLGHVAVELRKEWLK